MGEAEAREQIFVIVGFLLQNSFFSYVSSNSSCWQVNTSATKDKLSVGVRGTKLDLRPEQWSQIPVNLGREGSDGKDRSIN